MQTIIVTHLEDSIEKDIRIGDKYFILTYHDEPIFNMSFKKIKNIRKFLIKLYSALSEIEKKPELEGLLNFLYFTWLEDQNEKSNSLEKIAS